jgi:hypothetical protein
MEEIQEEQDRDWKDEYKENWLGAKLGYEGVMLDRVRRQQQTEETLARHARSKAGVVESGGEESGDDMGVSIGNKTFNHYTSSQQQQTETQPGGSSLLQKAVVAAALVAGGGGAGILASQLINPPAVIDSIDTDTDTISVIDFPE